MLLDPSLPTSTDPSQAPKQLIEHALRRIASEINEDCKPVDVLVLLVEVSCT